MKLMGAICVIVGCGSCGFLMGKQYLSNLHLAKNLITVLDYMQCELQYRGTPLPQLCREAGEQVSGRIRSVFTMLADELDAQVSANVFCCMASVLDRLSNIYEPIARILREFSGSLGKFDMNGQINALDSARLQCRELLLQMQNGKENRIRSYQTLGLCTGAAIAILFV